MQERIITNMLSEASDNRKHWYAILTRTNAERKVRDYFALQEVETFLPLQTRVIERNGKRIERECLLLPRMVFVYIAHSQIATVRNTMNVYDFLRDRSTNAPACIPDEQMANFRYMLDYSDEQIIITGDEIPQGTRVVVAKGSLQGLRGELVRYNNKYHILVRIDMFGSAMVSIPASYVRKEKNTL